MLVHPDAYFTAAIEQHRETLNRSRGPVKSREPAAETTRVSTHTAPNCSGGLRPAQS